LTKFRLNKAQGRQTLRTFTVLPTKQTLYS
jgi:hypothetical protein